MARKSVLIFVQIPTHFVEMIRVAELLQSSIQYRPVMLFMAMYQGVDRHIERCRDLGIECVDEREFWNFLPEKIYKKRGLGIFFDKYIYIFNRGVKFYLLPFSLIVGKFKFLQIAKIALRKIRVSISSIFLHVILSAQDILSTFSRLFYFGLIIGIFKSFINQVIVWVNGILKGFAKFLLKRLFDPVLSVRLHNSVASRSKLSNVLLKLYAKAFELILGLVSFPLKPLIRFFALSTFGFVYRNFPDYLPPDIKVQRYQWAVIPGIFSKFDIKALILPEDNFFYNTNYFVKAIHDRGGIAVVVPFTIVNMLEWAEAFYKEPSHDANIVVNRITSFLFPRWRHEHKGKALIQPFQQVLCNSYFKTAPPVPWLINSGHADMIAAESKFMADYYQRAGIPKKKIFFTGAMYDDVLYAALQERSRRREDLYERLKLEPGKPMVLCGIPPNQLLGAGRSQCEYSNYAELLGFFTGPLKKLLRTHHVILNFHPRVSQDEIKEIELDGMVIVTDNIANLVPLSHFYVASCSATIRLAINCGIPVVNYDVYKYYYDDYKNVPGVRTIFNYGEYSKLVLEMGLGGSEYKKLLSAQQQFSREQTQLDGKAGERLIGLLDGLLAGRRMK